MTKKLKNNNCVPANPIYPKPTKPPIWKIRNETTYAVITVIAHIVNAHL